MKVINSSKKGCRYIYDIMVKLNTCTSPCSSRKWTNSLNLNPDFNWKYTYKFPFIVTKDPKLQWFQFKINHRIIGTNHLLNKMGIKQDNICTFCQNEVETIEHLFYDCHISNMYLRDIKRWINR